MSAPLVLTEDPGNQFRVLFEDLFDIGSRCDEDQVCLLNVSKKAAYDAGLILNYVGEYSRQAADDKVSDWTTVDGQFNWRPPAVDGGTLTLGIDNIFDAEPPEDPYMEGWPFFNRALHSARGRFLYARYKHEF